MARATIDRPIAGSWSAEQSFLLELADNPLVHQVLRFQFAELGIDAAENSHRVAHAVHGGKYSAAVERPYGFVAGYGVFDLRQAQPFHQNIDNALFVRRILNIGDRFGDGSERALRDIRRLVEKTLARDDADSLKRDIDFGEILQDAKSTALRHSAEGIAEVRRIDDAADQALGEHSLIADDSHLNFISLRHQPPVVEGKHGERPHAAADALNADGLPFQVRGRSDFRRHHEIAVQLVDDARDEGEIESRRHGAEAGAGRRYGIKLRLVGRQRRNRDLAGANLHDLRVETLFFEKLSVFGDENKSRALVESGEYEDNLLQRRARVAEAGVKENKAKQCDAEPSTLRSVTDHNAHPSPAS